MIRFQIHQPKSFQEVPWRNGRGKTLVLLSEPIPRPNSGFDAFAYRLSIAGVANDGPFSRFPDCDRTLVLLEGKGMTLSHSNGQVVELRARFAEARFPGDIETVATLHDGPIRDFNVMWQRHHCRAEVTVLGDAVSKGLDVNCDLLLAYAVEGSVRALAPTGMSACIAQHELLQCNEPTHGHWKFSGGPVIIVQIRNL
jgi:environmental stress-induced protein Ves